MKVKISIISFGIVILILFIFIFYELSYFAWYPDIEMYNIHENRTLLNSFYGLPKLFIVILLFGMMMYFFAKAYNKIAEKDKPKERKLDKYEITASKEVWNKLPRKYRDRILEYYNKKKMIK